MWGYVYIQIEWRKRKMNANQIKKRILYSLKLYKLVYQVMECNKIKERGFLLN